MTSRRIVGMVLPVIAAALIATLSAAAAEPSVAGEGTRYAAAPSVQPPSLAWERVKPQPRSSSNLTPIRDLQADLTVSGSEPDPETFDKAGLDHWWSQHRKAAK